MICPHCKKLVTESKLKNEIIKIILKKKKIFYKDIQKELKKKDFNYQYAGVVKHLNNLEKEGFILTEVKNNLSGKPIIAIIKK